MNEDDALQQITDRLIANIEELFEFKDELETQFQYGERVAYTECLDAKMPEGVCFSSVFFGLEGRRKEKTATEKFFSYRGKNADTASGNAWLRPTDLPKRISEMKKNISDKIFRKSYGKNIQKHNKE